MTKVIEDLKILAKEDTRLDTLLEEVQEYAHLYLLAKQRQKGCDEMGEMETLKTEFIWTVEKMITYCKDNNFSLVRSSDNIESFVNAMLKSRIV